ncbi:MAG: SRPBCC domain-containing protein [Pseudomonadota bacterium]
MDILHDTVVLDRTFKAPPTRLFQAYTDPKQRQIWCVPGDGMVFDIRESEVRTGGRETATCGPDGDMRWRMDLIYHRVEQDRLVLFTEELWEHDMLLTVALITFDIQDDGAGGSKLTLTDQITSFVGEEAVLGHQEGYEHALQNLESLLANG